MRVWEDATGTASADSALAHIQNFQALTTTRLTNNTGVYWLTFPSEIIAGNQNPLVVTFGALSYVDLYLYDNGRLLLHKKSGTLRKNSELAAKDSRSRIAFPRDLNAHAPIVLLRVQHTRHNRRGFNFTIYERLEYLEKRRSDEAMDLRLQGALWVLLAYTLVCWMTSGLRAYGWLLLFTAGLTFFNLSSQGYFVNWFFPESPATGSLFNIHFAHLGILGLYLLLIDFWEIRRHHRLLYTFCKVALALLVMLSAMCWGINYFTGNYALTAMLNIWSLLFHIVFAAVVLWRCWPHLDRPKRYLAYGICMFILTFIWIAGRLLFAEEKSLNVGYLSSLMTIGIFLPFSAGLALSLKNTEKEGKQALNELNRLQEKQNELLEVKVRKQTTRLRCYNIQLLQQNDELAEKTDKIALLINELNHRVKNNLQLLYSIGSLQLDTIRDGTARGIFQENISRIKTMSLVNQRLYQLEELQLIAPGELVRELSEYIRHIYHKGQPVQINVAASDDIRLDSRRALYFSLMLTELLTNSFKYAFNDMTEGRIDISISINETGTVTCRYADNGTGLQPGANSKKSTGLSLVNELVRQLQGQLAVNHTPGILYELTFATG
ncbi:hypothetical protein MKQ68_18730 [Chitinophaga horti]|uniref:histidine kinase n=1 Tax=Chitinophaga horti TaxID=2920382 RepID=A0ABY6IXL4_9BACT|nr:histidine kinase dimerization/phosphoacceptor domain -containing protein [Chitinophaga horti]UYQ92127.1 hypothetical protein MKQ68_18730 [Chitinophaga horti]